MSVTWETMLLVLTLMVALGGIGGLVVVRRSLRQRERHESNKGHKAHRGQHPHHGKGGDDAARRERRKQRARTEAAMRAPLSTDKPAQPVKIKATTVASASVPLVAPDPEQAHQAKLQALQAMLELGDAKSRSHVQDPRFADTQPEPVDAGYLSTQFSQRGDAPAKPSETLDLDITAPPPKAPPPSP